MSKSVIEKLPPHCDKRPGIVLLQDARFMRGLYKSMAKDKMKAPVKEFRRMG